MGHRTSVVSVPLAAVLLLAVAACSPPAATPAPSGHSAPDEDLTAPTSGPRTLDGWLDLLDDELSRIGDGAAWSADSEVHVAPLCGPADEHEGWQVLATLAPGTGTGDLGDDWTLDPGSDSRWSHVRHDGLTLSAVDAPGSSGYLQVRAVTLGAGSAGWPDGEDDHHPRLHPPTLDGAGGAGLYCG